MEKLIEFFCVGPALSTQRYAPPLVRGKAAVLQHLLAMFHPRPFLLSRFGPQGAVACIRAQSTDYLEIAFRSVIHMSGGTELILVTKYLETT